MSPAPRVILLDRNAYFRLARSIRPLLTECFGPPPPYSLFVLCELEEEYYSSRRLQTKFEWFMEAEFRADRARKQYRCAGRVSEGVDAALTNLTRFSDDKDLGMAPEDLRALAVGLVRGFPVVTDDQSMQ